MITKLAWKNSNVKILAVFAILCLGACGGGIASGSATATPPTGTTPTGPVATGSTPLGNPPNLTPPLIDSPSALESRSSGVAPLSVFFDATATTSALTTKPFHKLQYTWNFDDAAGTASGVTTWGNGAASGVSSRNAATGAVAGHVYEIPGTTHNPTLTIYDGVHPPVVLHLPTITVSDPNALTTYCFAATTTSAALGGCPSGAAPLVQLNFATAMSTAIAAGATRILFNRGDKFTDPVQTTITTQGPGLIGAYGNAALPIPVIQGTFDGAQLIFGALQWPSVNNCSSPTSCHGGQLADWRVMDLNFVGQATANTSAVNMSGSFNDITILRVSISGQGAGLGNNDTLLSLDNNTGWCCHHIWSGITVQDSTISNPIIGTPGNTSTYGYGVYLGGDRVSFSGNSVDLGGTASATESHVARFTYLGQAAITNNTLAHPGPTESNIKLMGPGFPAAWGGAGDDNPGAANHYSWCPTGAGCPTPDIQGLGQGYSRWVEISDNQFISGYNNYMVAAAPQNQNSDERIKDVVIERNQFVSSGFNTVTIALYLDGFDYTVRNNTFSMIKPGDPANAIAFIAEVGGTISVAPDDLMAYNNSYYSDYSLGNNINFLQVNTATTTVDVENNLVYTPNSTSGQTSLIFGTPKTGSIVTPNSTTVQMKTVSPSYSVMSPVNPSDFKPGTLSYATGTGAIVPVWTDFFGSPRGAASAVGAAYDMGAVNH